MNFLLLPVPPGGLPEPGGHPELPLGEIPGDGVCCIPAAPGSSPAGMGARTPQPSPAPCAVFYFLASPPGVRLTGQIHAVEIRLSVCLSATCDPKSVLLPCRLEPFGVCPCALPRTPLLHSLYFLRNDFTQRGLGWSCSSLVPAGHFSRVSERVSCFVFFQAGAPRARLFPQLCVRLVIGSCRPRASPVQSRGLDAAGGD